MARLREPFTVWPPMATLGRAGSEALADAVRPRPGRRAARRRHHPRLRAGARRPHQPEEPGDRRSRAVRRTRALAGTLGAAVVRGLQGAGVAACGKHFPGHGDTLVDSHVDLPIVEHGPDRLRAIEFEPFRAAIAADVAFLMTAHVLVPALDERVAGDAVGADPAPAARRTRLRRRHPQRRSRDAGGARPLGAGRIGGAGRGGGLRRRARLQRRRRGAGGDARGAGQGGGIGDAAAGTRRRRPGPDGARQGALSSARPAGAGRRRPRGGRSSAARSTSSWPPRWRGFCDRRRRAHASRAGAGRAVCWSATGSRWSRRPARCAPTTSSAAPTNCARSASSRSTTTACWRGTATSPGCRRPAWPRWPRRGATRRSAASSPCAAATARSSCCRCSTRAGLPTIRRCWSATAIITALLAWQTTHGTVAFHGPMAEGRLALGAGRLRPGLAARRRSPSRCRWARWRRPGSRCSAHGDATRRARRRHAHAAGVAARHAVRVRAARADHPVPRGRRRAARTGSTGC